MTNIKEIDKVWLNQQKTAKISPPNCEPSYSELWMTPDHKILKLYTAPDGLVCEDSENINHDIATLGDLLAYDEVLGTRFATPDTVFTMGNEVIGYTMPFIIGTPLSSLLPGMSVEDIKGILCQIYRDVLFVHDNTPFSLCDLHEDNIILDRSGQLVHIDLDGWYNGDGYGRRARYLSLQSDRLADLPHKYQKDNRGNWIADLNSDIFCLLQIALNYFAQTSIYFSQLPHVDALGYFDYLHHNNIAPAFALICKCLYSEGDNLFDEAAILSLPDNIEEMAYEKYLKHISLFKSEESALEYLLQKRERIDQLIEQIRECQ